MRSLRRQKAAATPSRTARRAGLTAARRTVRDADRALRRNRPGGRADRIRSRVRAGQDARRAARLARVTERRTHRPAARQMRRTQRRAAGRYVGGRALAGLLRRLRLHRAADRVRDGAEARRSARRQAARDRYADATRPPRQISPKVQRAPRAAPVLPRTFTDPKGGPAMGQNSNGQSTFSFRQHTEDMLQDAQSYDPDGAMDVLAFLEELPEALGNIGEVFKVLAEKSDSELPFDRQVGEALNEIHQALTGAVDKAEDASKTFRQVHEADIERHENPRNGQQAEAKWNVGNDG
ncbi:hypothetical protein ACWD4F_02315 [Streptomyces aureus]